jgi:hypothetical protein
MVIFRRKNVCEISTENYVLCSFEFEKDPTFRFGAIRRYLLKNGLFKIDSMSRLRRFFKKYITKLYEVQITQNGD